MSFVCLLNDNFCILILLYQLILILLCYLIYCMLLKNDSQILQIGTHCYIELDLGVLAEQPHKFLSPHSKKPFFSTSGHLFHILPTVQSCQGNSN